MDFSDEKNIIPEWILYHLKKYGNCCCGREIVKKIGKEKILQILKQNGFSCELRIVHDKGLYESRKRVKYPRNACYILEIECAVKSYFI